MNSRTTRHAGARAGAYTWRTRAGATALGLSIMIAVGVVPASAAPADSPELRRTGTASPGTVPVLRENTAPRRSDIAFRTPGTPGPTTVEPPAVVAGPELTVGSVARNAVTDRREVVVPDVRRTAVLIGDSQATGQDSWPQLALRALGYDVSFSGAGGTGFVVANQEIGAPNYYDAFTSNTWVLPHGDPALVVVEGGGNDAARGASDGEILASANALLLGLERTYPQSRIVMIGTLSRSPRDGGGRRSEVDALLRGLSVARGITFISPGDWLTTHELEDFLADKVHLTQQGNQKAAVILEHDMSALKLGATAVLTDPLQWPHWKRPLD